MKRALCVYGDRRGPAALGNLVAWAFEPRGMAKTRMVHPTRSMVRAALREVDLFWFWGHGNDGLLHLGSGESLDPLQDLEGVCLKGAELRACYSVAHPGRVEAWRRAAGELRGFSGVTMELWGWPHRMVRL